jgi:hypothetical protein
MFRPLAVFACACVALMGLAPAVAQAAQPPKRFYVSLGDSYASGWQPTGVGQGRNTHNGFAYQVPRLAARRGYRLVLVNFGCGGATTTSLIAARGCARWPSVPADAPTRAARSSPRPSAFSAPTGAGRRWSVSRSAATT